MSLVWREQLSVANDIIDTDHKRLIDILNQVERSLNSKNRKDLYLSLYSLSEYSVKHFAMEEKIARAAGYPEASRLSESHELLVKQLDQVKLEIEKMGAEWSAVAAEQFSGLLRNWLIDHVIKEDLLLKPFLKKLPASFSPA